MYTVIDHVALRLWPWQFSAKYPIKTLFTTDGSQSFALHVFLFVLTIERLPHGVKSWLHVTTPEPIWFRLMSPKAPVCKHWFVWILPSLASSIDASCPAITYSLRIEPQWTNAASISTSANLTPCCVTLWQIAHESIRLCRQLRNSITREGHQQLVQMLLN